MLTPADSEVLDELVARNLDAGKTALERWCPQTPLPSQQMFLDATEPEVLFGGQAGPGKSSGILMRGLKYVDVPGYSALLLKKTYADLSRAGALMDRLGGWLAPTAARWVDREKAWRFPSGAVVAFGYLDNVNDHLNYQGPEYQLIGIDELTQHRETQPLWMQTRLRSIKELGVPEQFVATTNPGGPGHRWVKARYVDPLTRADGCRFIPARLEDNIHIDVDSYRKKLMRQGETVRRQLLEGEWIEDVQGLVYKFIPSRNLTSALPDSHDWSYVLGVDFGASQSKPTTSFSVWAYSVSLGQVYLVLSYKQAALTVSDIADTVTKINNVYDLTRMVADQGALGIGYIREMRQRYGLPITEAKKKNKFGNIKMLNSDLESGRAMIVDGRTGDWQEEASTLLWDDTGLKEMKGMDNHCCDGALYGYMSARHFLYKEPEALPQHGTTAYYEREEKRMIEHELEIVDQTADDALGALFS